eukprot:CAMPEP_0206261564 /NCGR_PEP_ID=MMETSP0047_2-20121206/27727_1 /ASSEMBLY_ACC=CAM_ASM_000192 /TAXON_ID=195065 /ORGANISM="Chroomonas mesostigmatica_cf, Strain CCMP1168" /LENGTH=200 /DNA_ID=CAMNT_0053688797 /DNA_START=127 /DNA_END=730 /DNA_ORIENTATION=-
MAETAGQHNTAPTVPSTNEKLSTAADPQEWRRAPAPGASPAAAARSPLLALPAAAHHDADDDEDDDDDRDHNDGNQKASSEANSRANHSSERRPSIVAPSVRFVVRVFRAVVPAISWRTVLPNTKAARFGAALVVNVRAYRAGARLHKTSFLHVVAALFWPQCELQQSKLLAPRAAETSRRARAVRRTTTMIESRVQGPL